MAQLRMFAVLCCMVPGGVLAAALPEPILFCRTVVDPVDRAHCYDRAVDAVTRPEPTETAGPVSTKPDAADAPVVTPAIAAPVTAETPATVPGADTELPTPPETAAESSETPVEEPTETQVSGLEQQVADLQAQVAALKQKQGDPEAISPEELFGKEDKESRDIIQKVFGVASIEEIESTVTEIKRSPYGKLVLVLENGQIWTQLDSAYLSVVAGDGVRIEAALSGSFLLEKQTGSRSIRVRRID